MDIVSVGDFMWNNIMADPKAKRLLEHRTHRTTRYETLHTGGFLRFCTERGRTYWVAQNETEHTAPDWKLHFSVDPMDVPKAWDIIIFLFVSHGLDFGMKARTDFMHWPEDQRGRELTVYIFRHDNGLEGGGPMADLAPEHEVHEYWLGPEFELPWSSYERFALEVESALIGAGIRSNGGVATGDLVLPGLNFASLRNEAYVPVERVSSGGVKSIQLAYPPNAAGWNAAGHPCIMPIPPDNSIFWLFGLFKDLVGLVLRKMGVLLNGAR